jgi:hypothetical protein
MQYAACEEIVRTQVASWNFEDASEMLISAGVAAEAVGMAAVARLQCIRGWFLICLDRFDEGTAALNVAEEMLTALLDRRDVSSPDPAFPIAVLRFSIVYLRGFAALAQGQFEDVLVQVRTCRRLVPIADLPPFRDALGALELETRLESDSATIDLNVLEPPPAIAFGIVCPELVRAKLAVLNMAEDARGKLRVALDALEERAHQMPLDCDRAFARLADAANLCGERGIAERAAGRGAHFYALRIRKAAAQLSNQRRRRVTRL